MENFGLYIKNKRESLGLTREDLIYKIEYLSEYYFAEPEFISTSTLARIEHDKILPTLKQIDLLSLGLNADLLQIYSKSRVQEGKKIKSIIKAIPFAIKKNDIKKLILFKNFLLNHHNTNSMYIYKIINDHILLIDSYMFFSRKDYKAAHKKSSKIIYNLKYETKLDHTYLKSDYNLIAYSLHLASAHLMSGNSFSSHKMPDRIIYSKDNIYKKVAIEIIKRSYEIS
ncbi:helix-turn-helix domain-containing protein [Ezakiella peruensis]|uniref:helix-turn-helix domain-containing protein n=1 Tax=Ezakiella peruensis TaxID=1464038 RepID=UPI000C1B4F29|nr:hypothetical protein [Ezakiella peruensis]